MGQIGDRAQMNTQLYGKRPYGVGLLVTGVDDAGAHLYEFQPSGIVLEMLACAIGARSQMARTYLERNLDKFESCGRDELIDHGLKALKESLPQDKELTIDNTAIGVVGVTPPGAKSETFTLVEGPDCTAFLDKANEGDAGTTGGQNEQMEVDS